MARFIVKIRDRYLEWSTVVDAPVTGGMTLDEFREYYLAEYGPEAEEHFDRYIPLADENGSSNNYNWRSNWAGPEETCLTEDELYRVYCLGAALDDETIRQKIAEQREQEEDDARSRPAPQPLGGDPTAKDIKTVFESLDLNTPLADVEALLGKGIIMVRKRRPFVIVRWIFNDLVISCHFEKESGKLAGKQLLPNYRSTN